MVRRRRVFKGETVHWEIQSPKDRRWYSIVNTPIFNPDGTLSKQALIRDISDAKRTEGDLNHALDRLEHEVEIRTAELQMKNRQLMEEIAERKRAEEARPPRRSGIAASSTTSGSASPSSARTWRSSP